MSDPETTRQLILDTVEDLAIDFLDYGRREDEELPRGAIEQAIADGVISQSEITGHFGWSLAKRL